MQIETKPNETILFKDIWSSVMVRQFINKIQFNTMMSRYINSSCLQIIFEYHMSSSYSLKAMRIDGGVVGMTKITTNIHIHSHGMRDFIQFTLVWSEILRFCDSRSVIQEIFNCFLLESV